MVEFIQNRLLRHQWQPKKQNHYNRRTSNPERQGSYRGSSKVDHSGGSESEQSNGGYLSWRKSRTTEDIKPSIEQSYNQHRVTVNTPFIQRKVGAREVAQKQSDEMFNHQFSCELNDSF